MTEIPQRQPGMPWQSRPSSYGLIDNFWRFSVIGIGAVTFVFVLYYAQIIIKPVFLAVVIGLMVGPVADRLERMGLPTPLSAACVLILLICVVLAALTAFAMPLAGWIERLPEMWTRLQTELAKWQGLLNTVENLQKSLKSLISDESQISVTLDDGSTMAYAAYIAPAILAQIAMFLVSVYFFIATRHEIRHLVLGLCLTRRLRWRMARVFGDVENRISRYLLSITAINLGLGLAVSLALWLAGVPSPFLFGMLAAVLNYVVYIGPAVMIAILLGVGLVTGQSLGPALLPAGLYLVLNFIEAQFVSPQVIGRSMRINPFFVFLALSFWIWLWGPIGGFIAVPAVLIAQTAIEHIFGRGTANQSRRRAAGPSRFPPDPAARSFGQRMPARHPPAP